MCSLGSPPMSGVNTQLIKPTQQAAYGRKTTVQGGTSIGNKLESETRQFICLGNTKAGTILEIKTV